MNKTTFRSTNRRFSWMITLQVLLAFILNSSSCKEEERTTPDNSLPDLISYQQDIYTMMQVNCTPCHFPANGHEKMLNTYDSVKNNIDEILIRVQLDINDTNFMPYQLKKPALTEKQIQLFNDWKSSDFPE